MGGLLDFMNVTVELQRGGGGCLCIGGRVVGESRFPD